jgi:phosphatidylinositol-3-phosphatase
MIRVALLSCCLWFSCSPASGEFDAGVAGAGGNSSAGGNAGSTGGGAMGGGNAGGVESGGGIASGGGAESGGGSGASAGGTQSGGGANAAGGSASGGGTVTGGGVNSGGGAALSNKYVFVIAMENENATGVYGNVNAPYINNTLMTQYAHAGNYSDVLMPLIPSEPHMIWLEGGTNVFGDKTFLLDSDPSAGNSTNDTAHIATKLVTAGNGKNWRAYQEGINTTTGLCPINSDAFYAAKHDPFVFFQDIAGSPPSKTNSNCMAHHKDTSALTADLLANDVASYTFITPNLCNDMHGASGCANGCTSGTAAACVPAGDMWLANHVPAIINFINANGGVLFIVWDEPQNVFAAMKQPFLVIGPNVKVNYTSAVSVNHSSYVKSVERLLGLPINARVSAASDFSDFFTPGHFP